MSTTVCAIVPTYNRAHLIGECLDSLLCQTRPLSEIIVVDDGSTDTTRATLDRYAARVRILRQPNSGKAAALNRALSEASSDYVWICDDDDVAEPYACAELAGALDADPAAAFAYGRFRRFRDTHDAREILPMSYWPQQHEAALFLALLERCFIFQFSSMVRRSLYAEVGLFDPTMLRSQDYEMCLRMARRHRGAYVAKDLFLQRQHDGARGANSDRFTVDASASKWVEYDRRMLKRLRAEVTLDELTPPFARTLIKERSERAALLQRACICGRHAMWDETVADLEQACALMPTASASPDELAIAERTLIEADMVDHLVTDQASIDRMAKAVRDSVFGRSIAASLAAPLFWQVRSCIATRQGMAAWRRLRLLTALGGAHHLFGRGVVLALRRLRGSHSIS